MKRGIWCFLFLVTCLFGVRPAYALVIVGDSALSTEKLGDFYAELNYSFSSETNATLALTLTNTSPVSNGGYLTAFAFNNPGGHINTVSLSGTDGDFSLLGATPFNNGIKAVPFGYFDIGASTTADFLNGGNPSVGIGVGYSAAFSFALGGTNLDTLSAQSFIDALSVNASPDKGGQFFAARFRGFNDGGSDNVPGKTDVVPEPASMLLLTTGLLATVLLKKRK